VYLALIIEPLGAAPLVEIDYVTVGDPGNPNDSTGYGQVDYVYQIGKYEVTCAQYAAFLNARAKRDTNGLYNPGMASSSRGGIVRAGTEGSYTHTVKAGFANVPVCFVNFYDALRFCNWLHNGAMEFSDTETGAYALSGSNVPGIERTNKALVFLPSDNEWYKAAYYHATSSGGPANGYWLYPTKSNVAPVGEPPSGGVNSAN